MDKSKFENKYYYLSLKKKLIFETKSFLGRLFSPSIRKTDKEYLELGSGNENKQLERFEHLDFYNISFKNFFSLFNLNKKTVGHDLRYRLPYNENTFKGVFMEHTLEHLHPFEAIFLISEIKRILKPSGIVRITVPDLDIYIDEFNKKERSEKFSNFINGCEIIWSLTQNYGHLSVWNFEMLNFQLKKNGFSNIRKHGFKSGLDKNLFLDRNDRKFETLYVEAKKT